MTWRKIDRTAMAELFRAGKTCEEIAGAFGATEETIRHYLIADGLREKRVRGAQKAISETKLRELAKAGKTAREIAEAMGHDHTSIRRFARQHHIKIARALMGGPVQIAVQIARGAVVEMPAPKPSVVDRHYRPAIDWDAIPLSRSAA